MRADNAKITIIKASILGVIITRNESMVGDLSYKSHFSAFWFFEGAQKRWWRKRRKKEKSEMTWNSTRNQSKHLP